MPYVSIQDTLNLLESERMLMTWDQSIPVREGFIPWSSSLILPITRLPNECGSLVAAIYEYLEGEDAQGYVRYPVASITIDREADLITVIGDKARAHEMQPLHPPQD